MKNSYFLFFIFLYNIGTSQVSFEPITLAEYQTNGVRGIQHIDLDKDGDFDIVTANRYRRTIVIFLNDGNAKFSPLEIFYSETISPSRLNVTDFNNDGNIDIVASGYKEVFWLKNDGNLNFTYKEILNSGTNRFQIQHISVVDIDKDNDIDILYANEKNNRFVWLENNNNDTFSYHMIYDNIYNPKHITHADINSDGYIDILGSSTSGEDFIWFKNDGNQNFEAITMDDHNINFSGGTRCVEAGDLNNDGHIDVVAARDFSNEFTWFKNDGSQNFTPITIFHEPKYTSGANTVRILDMDNDGDLDVLGCADYFATSGHYWFENKFQDGLVKDFIPHIIDTNFDFTKKAYTTNAADFNNDGYLDVYGSGNDKYSNLYINSGDNKKFIPEFIDKSIIAYGASSIDGGDIDLDGDIDFVCNNSILPLLLNEGNNIFTPKRLNNDTLFKQRTDKPKFVDIDSDGDIDILGASNYDRQSGDSWGGIFLWYENDGHGIYTEKILNKSYQFSRNALDIAYGDFDNDNDNDVIGIIDNENGFIMFRNNVNENFEPEFIIQNENGKSRPKSIDVIDIDQDGDLDFLSSISNPEGVVLFINDGAAKFTSMKLVDLSEDWSDRITKIIAGDVDDDGAVDFVTYIRNSLPHVPSRLVWYKNNGNNNFEAIEIYSFINNADNFFDKSIWDFEFLDIDNDEDLDISIAARNGVYQLIQSSSNEFFLHAVNNLDDKAASTNSIAHCDFNNDGILDLISSSSSEANDSQGHYYSLFINQGNTLSDSNSKGNEDIHVKIFPNPSRAYLTIKSPQIIDKVELFNSLGQIVYSLNINEKNYNLRIDKHGFYIIEIYSDNQVIKKKIIIN